MPTIDYAPILSIDQGTAVASYLRGQAPKPTNLPAGYILPNGEPAQTPLPMPVSGGSAPAKKFPWAWVAAGMVGLGVIVLLVKRGR